MSSIPVIDISPLRGEPAPESVAHDHVAQAIDRACREIGFLVVTGHGIEPNLIAATRLTAAAFFDQPLAEKAKLRPPPGVMRGYVGLGAESIARSLGADAPSDLNESLAIGPLEAGTGPYFDGPEGRVFFADNLWPDEPLALRPAWSAYYRAMEGLAATMMQGFARALGLPADFFADKIDRHISRLRIRNYPAQAEPPLPGQLRAGAHTDHGALTLLHVENKPGGLQVWSRDSRWIDVPFVPDSYVVNIGDLMARWTNDRWVSTLHRVVNPPPAAGPAARRLSLVYFHNPNHDAVVECLPGCRRPGEPARHPPTTAGEHFRRQFLSMQLAAAD